MSKHEQKNCPRCHEVFECRSNRILQCDCMKLDVPEEVASAIALHYDDCLCLNCLTELSQAFVETGKVRSLGITR